MAALIAKSAVMVSVAGARPQKVSAPRASLKPAVKAFKPVSNAAGSSKFLVWNPVNNKMFETFSYLPPLSDAEIAKQVEYITRNGWTPCLEFSDAGYVSQENCIRFGPVSSNYYDNRYWTMWKLPMFGCTDSSQVLKEIAACAKAFPNAYVRAVAFDATRQVQVCGFLVNRPKNSNDWQQPENRSRA